MLILCKISRLSYSAHLGEFWGNIPLNEFRHCRNPQKGCAWAKHVVWTINRENLSMGSSWVRAREKIQYNQTGK